MRYSLAIASVLMFCPVGLHAAVTAPVVAQAVTPPPRAPGPTPPRPLSLQSLEIGGISSLSTAAQVQAKLGNPRRIEEKYWPCCGQIRILDYHTLRVQLIEDVPGGTFSVFSVSTQSPQWMTRDGVRVGDSPQRVLERYGPPSSTQQRGDIVRWTYFLDAFAAQLSFEVRHNRVVRMGFDEQLN